MPDPNARVVVAFDYGTNETGVAIGQTFTRTARGLTTLRSSKGAPRWREIEQLVNEHQPNLLLVGLPLNMDGTESPMSSATRAFADTLTRRTGLEVEMVDERLTTFAAKSNLEEARAAGTADNDHELAACLIAESWMAQN